MIKSTHLRRLIVQHFIDNITKDFCQIVQDLHQILKSSFLPNEIVTLKDSDGGTAQGRVVAANRACVIVEYGNVRRSFAPEQLSRGEEIGKADVMSFLLSVTEESQFGRVLVPNAKRIIMGLESQTELDNSGQVIVNGYAGAGNPNVVRNRRGVPPFDRFRTVARQINKNQCLAEIETEVERELNGCSEFIGSGGPEIIGRGDMNSFLNDRGVSSEAVGNNSIHGFQRNGNRLGRTADSPDPVPPFDGSIFIKETLKVEEAIKRGEIHSDEFYANLNKISLHSGGKRSSAKRQKFDLTDYDFKITPENEMGINSHIGTKPRKTVLDILKTEKFAIEKINMDHYLEIYAFLEIFNERLKINLCDLKKISMFEMLIFDVARCLLSLLIDEHKVCRSEGMGEILKLALDVYAHELDLKKVTKCETEEKLENDFKNELKGSEAKEDSKDRLKIDKMNDLKAEEDGKIRDKNKISSKESSTKDKDAFTRIQWFRVALTPKNFLPAISSFIYDIENLFGLQSPFPLDILDRDLPVKVEFLYFMMTCALQTSELKRVVNDNINYQRFTEKERNSIRKKHWEIRRDLMRLEELIGQRADATRDRDPGDHLVAEHTRLVREIETLRPMITECDIKIFKNRWKSTIGEIESAEFLYIGGYVLVKIDGSYYFVENWDSLKVNSELENAFRVIRVLKINEKKRKDDKNENNKTNHKNENNEINDKNEMCENSGVNENNKTYGDNKTNDKNGETDENKKTDKKV